MFFPLCLGEELPNFKDIEIKELPKFPDIPLIEVKPPTDASKDEKKAFAERVQVILHTCNENEYWAVLEKLKPPTATDGTLLDDHPVTFPNVGTIIGMFAGYHAALMKTGQADQCIAPLVKALRSDFPNAEAIIGVGMAYAKGQNLKFADVMVSDQIENCIQVKWVKGEVTNRGARPPVSSKLGRIFCVPPKDDWEEEVFCCTADDSRKPCLHIGCIVSAPWLMRDPHLRDHLLRHIPNVKGGEMEGWALLIVKDIYPEVGVIIIKGVADYGDEEKADNWQFTAAKAAVDYTHYRLQKTGCNEFKGKHLQEPITREGASN